MLLVYLAMKLKPKYAAQKIKNNNNTEANYYSELWNSNSLKNFIFFNYLLNC